MESHTLYLRPMTIYIDNRAGSRDLINYLPLDTLGQLTTLPSGDIRFAANGPDDAILVGIELKSLGDLIQSVGTGRLQGVRGQAPRMLNDYDICYFVYYGVCRGTIEDHLQVWQTSKYGGHSEGNKRWVNFKAGSRHVSWKGIEAFLIQLQLAGFHVKHCATMDEAAQWTGVIYNNLSKPWSSHHSFRSFDKSQEFSQVPGMSDQQYRVAKCAASLHGVTIGYERAVALSNTFPTVDALMNADVEDLQKVDGIGKVIAQAFVDAVRGK